MSICSWQQVLDPTLNREAWTEDELQRLEALIQKHGTQWGVISKELGTNRPALSLRNAYYARQRRTERLVIRQAATGASATSIANSAASQGLLALGPSRGKRSRPSSVAPALLANLAVSNLSVPDGLKLDPVLVFQILQSAIQGQTAITPFVAGLLQANGIMPGPDGRFPFQTDGSGDAGSGSEGEEEGGAGDGEAGGTGAPSRKRKAADQGLGAAAGTLGISNLPSASSSLLLGSGLSGLGVFSGLGGLGGLASMTGTGQAGGSAGAGTDLSTLVSQFNNSTAAVGGSAGGGGVSSGLHGLGLGLLPGAPALPQLDALSALYVGGGGTGAAAPAAGDNRTALAQLLTVGVGGGDSGGGSTGADTGGTGRQAEEAAGQGGELSINALFGLQQG